MKLPKPHTKLSKFPCDFLVNTHGAYAVVTPTTRRGKAYTKRNIHLESWQWVTGAIHTGHPRLKGFTVEHRYLHGLIASLSHKGYEVHTR